MTTEADYDFMKAVFDKINVDRLDTNGAPPLPFNPNTKKALTQVRARLFTIKLQMRQPSKGLPFRMLMDELIEKHPLTWHRYYGCPAVLVYALARQGRA